MLSLHQELLEPRVVTFQSAKCPPLFDTTRCDISSPRTGSPVKFSKAEIASEASANIGSLFAGYDISLQNVAKLFSFTEISAQIVVGMSLQLADIFITRYHEHVCSQMKKTQAPLKPHSSSFSSFAKMSFAACFWPNVTSKITHFVRPPFCCSDVKFSHNSFRMLKPNFARNCGICREISRFYEEKVFL